MKKSTANDAMGSRCEYKRVGVHLREKISCCARTDTKLSRGKEGEHDVQWQEAKN